MPKGLYPLLFRPVYKDYLWGGRRIIDRYGRDAELPVAESWEVSAHPDGLSIVENGPLAGKTLAELVEEYSDALLGEGRGLQEFPLLIKMIDANKCLSVQVHPNDVSAAKFGGEAKSEMWYVLDADEGSCVFAGFRRTVDQQEFASSVVAETVPSLLRREVVRAGDAIYIPGGLVHAIDAGCLLLEVQQSSNTTYRIYDWGRVDVDGKPRDLHLDQAIHVMVLEEQGSAKVDSQKIASGTWGTVWLVHESPYFRMERWNVQQDYRDVADPTTFRAFFCAEGAAMVRVGDVELKLVAGQSCLLPACVAHADLSPVGDTVLLRILLPSIVS